MSKVKHDSATPAHGQQVISAVAFIHKQFDGVNKVFLPKRAATKAFLPGLYEMIGGHIDYGEDIVTGLKREIVEEVGMDCTIADPFAVFTYMDNVKGSHSVEAVYFGTFIGDIDKIKVHPEDHSGFAWFSREDVVDHKSEIIPSADNAEIDDQSEDPEYLAILKGFDLLEGSSPQTS
jgi:8-oxo-dGTP diphosphatase